MGYFSEVRCIVYGEPERMLRFVTAQKLTRPVIFSEFGGYISEYMVDSGEKGTAVLDLNIGSAKWYDDFENVRAWVAMLQEIDDLNDEADDAVLEYEFIRVGEENGDVETRYSSITEGWIFARTIISADLPHKVKEVPSDETTEG